MVKYSRRFCTSDDSKITSALELNKIKIEGYMRNINIEDVNTLRCIETLGLNNYYLLNLYLKDVYFIFLHFVTHLADDEDQTLLHREKERNAFLFNTEIRSYDSFLEEVRRLRSGSRGLGPGADAYNGEEPNKGEATRGAGIGGAATEGTLNGGHSTLGQTSDTPSNHPDEDSSFGTNQPKNNYHPRFGYANELFYHLYSEDEIELRNIDKEVNARVKKENIFDRCTRINNNIIVYMLSYLYFNDKLKRLRLDYNFHFILFNKARGEGRDNATTSPAVVEVEGEATEGTLTEPTRLTQEDLFLIYLSHFKFYIVSFFLYSYVKFKGSNTSRRTEGRRGSTAPGSASRMTDRGAARSTPPPDKEQFLYNHEDNRKNVASVSSYISNFVNKVLHDIDIALKTNRSASNIDAGSGETDMGSSTREMINEILKNKLSFKQVTLSHLDFCLSCIVLLNLCSPDGMQSCLYYGITYSHFCHTLERYSASLGLGRELQRANYFCFFEGIKQLSFIERCCLFPNVKQIRLDYLHSILFSANNRNYFSLNISFIDQCIAIHNEDRTTYMLQCLGMHMKGGRVYFNMSSRRVEGGKPNDAPRCALLDNKQNCVDLFLKTYQDRIEDYVYILYDEKNFDRERCYRKFDVPAMVCFGPRDGEVVKR
ncbi:hypothetical protein C922_01716 [Plasmodium inui San Antonio 1]|uniref:Uncharacterized protein n=1 Tax=Plasmodium inui San Antonio 1 TaxID=1237626 RepID=W7AGI2_9APIC|nr:hypothetical protein C922_01716 [Plasmodium inui San Antonio 1]EUD68104.1 hypothetical protein C922_01716 [Plasmodium inui San Antonio 1]